MPKSRNFIETFAESLFHGDGDRCVFESSASGPVTLADLAFILAQLESRSEAVDADAEFVENGACSIKIAIAIIAAMCLGARIKILDFESGNRPKRGKSLSLLIENFHRAVGVGMASLTLLEALERCKNSFISNVPRFELELQTSGSTSARNRVILGGHGICYQAVTVAAAIGMNHNDRQLMYMPLNYVYGLSVLTTSLCSGATLVETDVTLEQPKSFFDQISEKRITVFSGVPYVYNLLSKRWGVENLTESSLRILTQAGGSLNSDVKIGIMDSGADLDFWVMYGQTELCGRICQFNLTKNRAIIDSVGPPLDGVLIAVDPNIANHSNLVEGEILVHSISVAKNIKELARCVKIDGISYYATGDIGYVDDGHLYITGRNKNYIKVAGRRISLEKIEMAYRSLASVIDCVVEFDETRFPILLVGIVSERFETLASQQEIKSLFSAKLADECDPKKLFAGVPYYIYVIRGSLPRLPSHKLDLSSIKKILKKNYYEKKPIHIRL